jgi:hypothetical protein
MSMLTSPFNPKEEKDALYGAVSRFQEHWDQARDIRTVLDLCDAAERADEVLRTLEAQDTLDHDTRLQVLQLKILLTTAKQALTAILEDSDDIAPSPEHPPQHASLSETILPAGPILDCPECGEGLYKVTQETSTAGIVLDDGTVVVPLNQSISARDAWKPLACPLCGGRLLKDGKIHTFQDGWR